MTAKLDFLPENFADHIVAVEAVDVGTHQIYRCYSRDGTADSHLDTWYVKSVKTPQQHADFKREIAVSLQIQNALVEVNVAQLLWAADNGEHAIFTRVPGNEATKKQLITELTPLLNGLREVHNLPLNGLVLPSWHLEDLVAEITNLDLEPDVKATMFEHVKNIQVLPFTQSSYMGLVHGDLNAGNVLYDPTQKRWGLLDWECAQFTDVRWDLASLCVEFDLSVAQSDKVFQQYAKLTNINDDQFVRYQQSWQTFYRLTCLVWAIKHNYPTERYQIT